MEGDDVSRFCFRCSKTVYDLGAMDDDEAEAFLERHLDAGGVLPCMRLFRRPDGRVLTSECAPGARRRHLRRAAITVGGTLAAAAAAIAGVARATEPALGPDVLDERDVELDLEIPRLRPATVPTSGMMSIVDDDDEDHEPENERLGTAARSERRAAEERASRDATLAGSIRLVRRR